MNELSIDDLQRWALFGAHWRVIELGEECAVVELRTCTAEPVERRQVHDAAVIDYLRTRPAGPDSDAAAG